jgi:predicted N-acetyltransferase YhbS
MTNIRAATPADDASIVRTLIETFEHLYATMGVEMSQARRAYLSDQAARRAFATSFVYETDGKVVGTVTLTPPSSHSEAWLAGAWDLRLLAVDPNMHGRGIATTLIDHAEQHALAEGATEICLHARRGIARQARLYVSRGYNRDLAGDLNGPPYQEGYRKRLAQSVRP